MTEIKRKTAETDISLSLSIYGGGKHEIETGAGFLDHMLTLFAVHGGFDLAVKCVGDTNVDYHHTAEDIGICLGDAFARELDVRGMTGDEAWFKVDKYIDDACLAGVASVRIIHGKGTGALRAALWGIFRKDKRIATYRQGVYGEGDAGVTVIELK